MKCILVGCGHAARSFHLPALRDRCVGVVDSDPAARRGLPYPSASSLPELAVEYEAAVVAAPTAAHFSLVSELLRRRVHVFVEKPLCVTVAQARQLVELQAESGVQAMVGFNQRFRPAVVEARRRWDEIGVALCARGYFGCPRPTGWREPGREGGGLLLDLASHHLDLLPWLAGSRPARVEARRTNTAGYEGLTLRLELESGLVFQGLYQSGAREDDTLEVFGTAGGFSLRRGLSWPRQMSLQAPRSKREGLRAAWELIREVLPVLRPGAEPSYRRALEAFFQGVRTGREVRPNFQDGLATQILLEQAAASAASCGG